VIGTDPGMNLVMDFCVIAILILGIWLFRWPDRAKFGNLTAAFALACGAALVLYRSGTLYPFIVIVSLVIGSAAGYFVARKITMIQIPAMVAFQHGAGGVAAFSLSLAELMRGSNLGMINEISGLLGLAIGSFTFSASMVAGGKLSNRLGQTPRVLPNHTRLVMVNLLGIITFIVLALYAPMGSRIFLYLLIIFISILFGVLFSIRIGGADMPVLISFLNATAGVAAAFCGMIIENKLLISCGATVAASGSILTHVMCQAMNRSLFRIFVPVEKPHSLESTVKNGETQGPYFVDKKGEGPVEKNNFEKAVEIVRNAEKETVRQLVDRLSEAEPVIFEPTLENRVKENLKSAVAALLSAKKIIIIPGYGMALAQAQFKVVELASILESMGAEVKFAIHPVAGRMPGHMNVLLAEADVDYDKLYEMEEINPEFSQTEAVLIFGACDVVNPAAMETKGTPISGMPILMAHDAEKIIICNFDAKPGYSGVENSLYDNPKTIMLPGDAALTADDLIHGMRY